jgi:hypothetical protein
MVNQPLKPHVDTKKAWVEIRDKDRIGELLELFDAEDDVLHYALSYYEYWTAFRCWIIPTMYQPLRDIWIANTLEDDQERELPEYDPIQARDEWLAMLDDDLGALGILTMVGPVLLGMKLRGEITRYGIGGDFIRSLQTRKRYRETGLLGVSVVGGQKMLTRCGFTKLPRPTGYKGCYAERPWMSWQMDERTIRRVTEEYDLLSLHDHRYDGIAL